MILVIGATGYIGRYFCTEMSKRGVDILALGRSEAVQRFFNDNGVPFQYFDLSDERSFEQLPKDNIEAIIDLSACLAELETPVSRFLRLIRWVCIILWNMHAKWYKKGCNCINTQIIQRYK